jgi:hypothetical protein
MAGEAPVVSYVYVPAKRAKNVRRIGNPANKEATGLQRFLDSSQQTKKILFRFDMFKHVDAEDPPKRRTLAVEKGDGILHDDLSTGRCSEGKAGLIRTGIHAEQSELWSGSLREPVQEKSRATTDIYDGPPRGELIHQWTVHQFHVAVRTSMQARRFETARVHSSVVFRILAYRRIVQAAHRTLSSSRRP